MTDPSLPVDPDYSDSLFGRAVAAYEAAFNEQAPLFELNGSDDEIIRRLRQAVADRKPIRPGLPDGAVS